jgi:hypothetical protein
VIAPNLMASATSFTDPLGTGIAVACYQLDILGAGASVLSRSDVLCVLVNTSGGGAPPRSASITTNESDLATIRWDAPSAGTQIGYLVVPLGGTVLPLLPPTATQAVDAPGRLRCYMVLTLVPDSGQVPFRIGGYSEIVCAMPLT